MRKSDGVTKRGMVTTIPWITEDILFTVKMKYIQLQRYYCDNASCDANDASSPAKTSGDLFGPSSTQKRQRHITTGHFSTHRYNITLKLVSIFKISYFRCFQLYPVAKKLSAR
ncbi:predicted protein [Histoplasma capsulatum H143]|uniref:Uncharacterized protein n=1 Tax=Ajellomyces capsulatus (strain H143) TaxID=544712 RepID=C6HCR7_AJECH|nr:predicted protein [Histoplasma capsulatum H143]